MRPKKETIPVKDKAQYLLENIIQSIQDRKGEDIISLDLREIHESVTDYFIICHATSTTQVRAIADNIIKMVTENTADKPWHKEGLQNMEWVLIDYVNIVVHIFKQEKRQFYRLEDLWSDAVITRYAES